MRQPLQHRVPAVQPSSPEGATSRRAKSPNPDNNPVKKGTASLAGKQGNSAGRQGHRPPCTSAPVYHMDRNLSKPGCKKKINFQCIFYFSLIHPPFSFPRSLLWIHCIAKPTQFILPWQNAGSRQYCDNFIIDNGFNGFYYKMSLNASRFGSDGCSGSFFVKSVKGFYASVLCCAHLADSMSDLPGCDTNQEGMCHDSDPVRVGAGLSAFRTAIPDFHDYPKPSCFPHAKPPVCNAPDAPGKSGGRVSTGFLRNRPQYTATL